MSSIKKQFLKPVSKKLIQVFSDEGITLKPTTSYQLISAAYGLWAHELAREFEVPFESYPVSDVKSEPFPGALPQFNEGYLVERISKLLELEEWKAQHLSQVVLSELRTSRLRINGLKVLFNQELSEDRESIFKALRNPVFPPIHASVAIAEGRLPQLPVSTLHERLNFVGSSRIGSGSLHNLVARSSLRILDFPSADIKSAAHAYADSFNSQGQSSAELGLGFCLIYEEQRPKQFGRRFSVIVPVLSWRSQNNMWSSVTLLSNQIRENLQSDEWKAITDVTSSGLRGLPELNICPNCLELFSDDSDDLSRKCSCTGDQAFKTLEFINNLRVKGAPEVTTIDVIEHLFDSSYEVDQGASVNESKNATIGRFLNKNSITFGIRKLGEFPATDSNGQRTTTAKWAIGNRPTDEGRIMTNMKSIADRLMRLHLHLEKNKNFGDDWASARGLEDAIGSAQNVSSRQIQLAEALLERYKF